MIQCSANGRPVRSIVVILMQMPFKIKFQHMADSASISSFETILYQ